jgi:hypothetical protein
MQIVVTLGEKNFGCDELLLKGEELMKSILFLALMLVVAADLAAAKEPLPDAPSEVAYSAAFAVESTAQAPAPIVAEKKIVDATFLSLAVISTGASFGDSYTTLFARENWLAGKKGVCNVEVESAYLYGTHPTVGRAYAVASAKSAVAIAGAYWLRKHHSRFWSMPLVANSVIGLQGVGQNLATCN